MTEQILYGERKLTLEPSEVWFSWVIASVILATLAVFSLAL
ncbi:MAG: hypothetical protein OET44_15615 [Gammaproteobacteria bacterium]|nr:hypothetical protein [Gammaproteobacteria bacterium]